MALSKKLEESLESTPAQVPVRCMEESTEAISRLAVSVRVMAEKQNHVADTVDRLDDKVTALETKPAKHWDTLVETIILSLAAAILGFAMAHMGL